jgi:hypothetical protein
MLSNLNSLARGLALVLAVAALAGCATSKEKLLTHGDRTMMDIWQQEAGAAAVAQPDGTPAANCSMRARACVGR